MQWVTPEKWDAFVNSENTLREAALEEFAIRVATNKDVISSLRSDVEKICDSDANAQFEIVRFNYEFVRGKRLETEASIVKSALSNLEKAHKKYKDYQGRQEKLEADWLEICRRAEVLRVQVDMILKPRRPAFSPHTYVERKKKLILNFNNFDSKSFLEQRSYFWGLIEERRGRVNQYMKVSGDISIIGPMEELRKIMLHLESMSPKFSRSAKYAEELRQKQEKFQEEVNALKRTLSGMGEFALYALTCLYNKLIYSELQNSSTLREAPTSLDSH